MQLERKKKKKFLTALPFAQTMYENTRIRELRKENEGWTRKHARTVAAEEFLKLKAAKLKELEGRAREELQHHGDLRVKFEKRLAKWQEEHGAAWKKEHGDTMVPQVKEVDEEEEESDEEIKPKAMPPKKQKKKKATDEDKDDEGEAYDGKPSPAKRGPGRPKKKKKN